MTQLQHPIDGFNPDPEHFNNRPKIALLTEKQWAYVRKRYCMTHREFQIARLACKGLNNDAIADELSIMPGTVKTHLRNIYRKAWVRNKISMLLRFVEDANNVGPITPDA